MADIDIINVGGTDYNIKDSTARSTASAAQTAANGKAPISHAVNASTYGLATGSAFGHVKLADAFDTRIGATADAIGASQVAVYNLYNKAYGNVQYQFLSSYGGGATCPITKNATYIGTGSNIKEFAAFKCGRMGIVKIGFTCMTAIPTTTDVVLMENIDFIDMLPVSNPPIGGGAINPFGFIWNYTNGITYPIVIERDSSGTKSFLRLYVGANHPIAVGDNLFGSAYIITSA